MRAREREIVGTTSNPSFCHALHMWIRIALPLHIDHFPEQQNISVFKMQPPGNSHFVRKEPSFYALFIKTLFFKLLNAFLVS
jgi:hypothetical protein